MAPDSTTAGATSDCLVPAALLPAWVKSAGIRPRGALSCRLLALQVHELDKRVLQSHSAPLMVNYIYKSTVVQGSLNMDEFCEPIKGEHSAVRPCLCS